MGGTERPEWVRRARAKWRYRGEARPPFAETPGPGQESVWDYPRPPRVEPVARYVLVRAGERVVADSSRPLRVLETASPPTFYVRLEDVAAEWLVPAPGRSFCEWKGEARYFSVRGPDGTLESVAWRYPDPFPGFEALADHVSFHPACLACSLDGRPVAPQPGGFYAGWITPELVGPFKGGPGSEDW